MPESSQNPGNSEIRRKRLRYRSRHRGTRELDLLLGSFAERHLDGFDEAQLARFEAILEVPEPLVQSWLVDRTTPPAAYDSDVLRMLLDHRLDFGSG